MPRPTTPRIESPRAAAERLGDIHALIDEALNKGSLEELLSLLKVALEDRDAPTEQQIAISRAHDSVLHDRIGNRRTPR